MSRFTTLTFLAAALTGCTTTLDPAVETDDAVAVAQQDLRAPTGCKALVAIARPIAAPQYSNPALQQTAGKLTLRLDHDGARTGTILATITGTRGDGSLSADHDVLFPQLGFRTRDDRVVATPTADPCVSDAATVLYVVEASGPLAGLTGTLHGSGQVNLCGGAGRVVISGYLCAAGGGS